MAEKKKLGKKELRGADAFQVKMMGTVDWLQKNRKTVGLVLTPILIVLVAGFCYQLILEGQREDRVAALSKAEIAYSDELTAAQKKRDELRKEIEDIDKSVEEAREKFDEEQKKNPPAEGKPKPVFQADTKLTEKREKLEKDIENIKADHSGSLDLYNKFFAANIEHPEGWMAGVRAATILIEKKDFTGAQATLEKVNKASLTSDFYQLQTGLMLISVLEELGQYDAGLQKAEQLITLVKTAGDDEVMPKVLLTKGRLLMLKNNKDQARETFTALLENHKSSDEAEKAQSFLFLLN